MTQKDAKAPDGAALWQAVRGGTLDHSAEEGPELDPSLLAAYLEGGLSEAEAAEVEAVLAADPAQLDLALAAEEALAAGTTAAPESLVSRARELVPEGGGAAAWRNHWLPAGGRALAFAGITAALVLVSLAGFELGRTGVAYEAEAERLLSADQSPDGEDFL